MFKYVYNILIKTNARSYYSLVEADCSEDALVGAQAWHDDDYPDEPIVEIEIIEKNLNKNT